MKRQALRIPKAIEPGDLIGVVAISMPMKKGEKEAMEQFLTEAGYRVKFGKTVQEERNFHNYLAGDGKTRAEDLNEMFADPLVDGIICARGGYGSCHVMPYLDLEMIRQNPKLFVGYSDITNIHSVLNKYCDLVTYHGPMVISNMLKGFDEYSRHSFQKAIHMEDLYEFVNPKEDPMWTVTPGKGKGMITGGNLTLIARSIGAYYQIETEGKILFLEDIEESIPSVDMMLTQLEQAGMMKNIAGLMFGNFSDCTNDRYEAAYTIDQFIRERFSDYHVPVLANVCSGHKRPMGTLPMGTICSMDAEEKKIVFSLQ